jgi:uncharacterized Fe-S cluster-containing protein
LRDIARLLPEFNCGECGFKSCRAFAEYLIGGGNLSACPFMGKEKFEEKAAQIERLLPRMRKEAGEIRGIAEREEIRGIIDSLRADFALAPLPGEPSCREDLYPFDREAQFLQGSVLRYRPLGCPITHFGRVLKVSHGLATVHIVGPRHLLGDEDFEFRDVGICMVAAFEGTVSRGRAPEVGETVRFLPEHCMMQKVHSGVVVHSEGRMVRIEGVDLKVW